MQFTKNTGKIS